MKSATQAQVLVSLQLSGPSRSGRLAVAPGEDVGAAPSTSPCSEQQGLSGDPPRRQPGRASRGVHSP